MSTLALPPRYDLPGVMFPLVLGRRDPTARVTAQEAWWTTLSPIGPATLHLARVGPDRIAVAGHGPGADWVVEQADAIAGLRDDLTGFLDVVQGNPLVYRLAREHAGLRLTRTARIFEILLPSILSQKVTGIEARRALAGIVRRYGTPAPGPVDGLFCPPDPEILAGVPYYDLHRFGVEQRRADTIRRAAAVATRLEAAPDSATAARRLRAIPGIGPWTVAETTRVAFGDPDPVSVGDFHIPHMVCWALAGEARGTDARMLELLAPFAGHRGRVCILLAAGGLGAPKFGPRMPIRSFAKF